jgi:hypothetical protein
MNLVTKILAALTAMSCLTLPAMAQEPTQDEATELIVCHFGGDLMTGAVLTGKTEITDANDTLPELPTIEDDGK